MGFDSGEIVAVTKSPSVFLQNNTICPIFSANAAKRDQDAWRQKIEQEIAAINHRIDFHSTLDATSSPSKKGHLF